MDIYERQSSAILISPPQSISRAPLSTMMTPPLRYSTCSFLLLILLLLLLLFSSSSPPSPRLCTPPHVYNSPPPFLLLLLFSLLILFYFCLPNLLIIFLFLLLLLLQLLPVFLPALYVYRPTADHIGFGRKLYITTALGYIISRCSLRLYTPLSHPITLSFARFPSSLLLCLSLSRSLYLHVYLSLPLSVATTISPCVWSLLNPLDFFSRYSLCGINKNLDSRSLINKLSLL